MSCIILIFLLFPTAEKISKAFGLQIQSLIKKRFDTKITIVYKTTKRCEYFSLSQTPLILNLKVVYKFIRSCDVNFTCISTSAKHLSVKAEEHLNISKLGRSVIIGHIRAQLAGCLRG